MSICWSTTAPGASISASGLFTAGPTAGTHPDAIIATAGNTSGKASVTVTGGGSSMVASVTVTPSSASLERGATQPFTAQVKDSAGNPVNVPVTWTVANAQAGSISGAGLFTAGTKAGAKAGETKKSKQNRWRGETHV